MKDRAFTRVVLFVVIFFVSAGATIAANCTVTTADDHVDQNCSADCSLREAVLEPSCTAIDFSLDLAGAPIVLTLGELAISRNLSITGWGADAIAISGNNTSRIFYIGTGAAVSISGMTLRNGNGVGAAPNNGGAIRNRGTLTVDGVYFTGNQSPAQGAAISFEGTASTVRNSTFTGNTGGGFTGAVLALTPGTGGVTMTNSTITGNAAPAIYLTGTNILLTNSTVIYNGPLGVYNGGMAGLSIGNSIVMDICRCSMLGGVSSSGTNIVSATPTSNQIVFHATDLVGVDPLVGGLAFNGGHTLTMATQANSPGTDTGSNTLAVNAGLTTDQRGYPRFADGGSGRMAADIGAFELNSPAPAPVTVAGRVLGAVSGNPVRSQTVAITDLLGNTRTTLSSSLGWFVFDNLPAGFVYRVSVKGRRGVQLKTVFAGQDLSDVDILVPGL
jgi:CSLREA domain-containing protein